MCHSALPLAQLHMSLLSSFWTENQKRQEFCSRHVWGTRCFSLKFWACNFNAFCRTLPAPPVSHTATSHPWHPNRWHNQNLGNQMAVTTVGFAPCRTGCRSFGHAILTYHTVPDLARAPLQTADSTVSFGPRFVESLPAEVLHQGPRAHQIAQGGSPGQAPEDRKLFCYFSFP